MSLTRKSLKQLLLNFLHAFAVDGPSLSKENQSCQPGIHLPIGWKKETKISESKQRWMLFVGATGESLRTNYGTKRCPIHQSTNHILQECKSFEGMLTNEKVKVVEEHKLCLCCLLPGHRLSKCHRRNRCKVENCDKRHHTLLHEVDLKFIKREKAKRESERVPDVERDPAQVSLEGEDSSPRQAKEHEGYRQSAYVGCEAGGRALVEVLPIVVFGEKGK